MWQKSVQGHHNAKLQMAWTDTDNCLGLTNVRNLGEVINYDAWAYFRREPTSLTNGQIIRNRPPTQDCEGIGTSTCDDSFVSQLFPFFNAHSFHLNILSLVFFTWFSRPLPHPLRQWLMSPDTWLTRGALHSPRWKCIRMTPVASTVVALCRFKRDVIIWLSRSLTPSFGSAMNIACSDYTRLILLFHMIRPEYANFHIWAIAPIHSLRRAWTGHQLSNAVNQITASLCPK